MLRIAGKIAARLGLSRNPSQRWRQTSIVLASLIATVAICVGAGFIQAANRVDVSLTMRTPIWAPDEASANFLMSARAIILDGQQFPIQWLVPSAGQEDNPDIVPPGLNHFPEPGEAVLSPGLITAGYSAEDFGFKTHTAGLGESGAIGNAGVATESEWFMYARPDIGQTLGEGGALLPFLRYQSGHEVESSNASGFVTDHPLATQNQAIIGVLALIIFPSLLLSGGASRAVSAERTHRMQVLVRLGTPARITKAILAIETLVLSAFGAVPGAIFALLVLPGIREVPFTQIVLKSDGLAAPWWWASAVVAIVVLTNCLTATFGPVPKTRARKLNSKHRWHHLLPLVAGIALVADVMIGTGVIGWKYSGGVALIILGMPLALPVLASAAATIGTKVRSPRLWLAAKRLRFSPARLTRPAAVIGILTFVGCIAVSVLAMFAQGLQISPTEPTSGRSVIAMNWRGAENGNLALIAANLATEQEGILLPIERSDTGKQTTYYPLCASLEVLAPRELTCSQDQVTKAGAAWVEQTYNVELAGPAPEAIWEAVLISPHSVADIDIYAAAQGQLPALNILANNVTVQPPPMLRWVLVGSVITLALATIAVLRELGDRAILARVDHARLVKLGLTEREIRGTDLLTHAIPILLSIGIGYACGLLAAFSGSFHDFTRFEAVKLTAYSLSVLAMGIFFMLTIQVSYRKSRK